MKEWHEVFMSLLPIDCQFSLSFLFDGNFALDRIVNTLYNGKADGV